MTLTFSIPDTVCAIIQRLESHGYEAYAVGGCVRDMLCGRTPHDLPLRWEITRPKSSLFEGVELAARCAGGRQAERRRSGTA